MCVHILYRDFRNLAIVKSIYFCSTINQIKMLVYIVIRSFSWIILIHDFVFVMEIIYSLQLELNILRLHVEQNKYKHMDRRA